ncbi:MAG: hypothetical protein VB078_06925 [Clostridiaceae bacterium]|nr:hypothetical protein [Clostridiaceae bacterium]
MSTKKETDMSTEEETELKKAPAVPLDPEKDKVDFYAFKDNDKYKDDIFVAVNGKTFKIQRGKHVRIPRYVAEVLANSMDQDARTANLMEKEASAYNIASKANII